MKRGFTLIEVLAVIVILAIIATITTPIILNTIEDAEKREFKNQVNIVKKNLDYYLIENNKNQYPNCSETKNVSFSDLLLKNVSYFEDGYVCYDTKNEKNYIYARNDKYVAYGTVDNITIKLLKEFDEKDIIHYAYTGIPSGTYKEGESIDYAGLKWLVIKDNGNNTTLILKDNYGYGIYGSSVDFVSGNNAYDKVNTEFVNAYSDLKKDIDTNGIIKDSSTKSSVRLPRKDELSTKIANGSAFWTMTANGTNLWYATTNGLSIRDYIVADSNSSKTYYYGYGDSADYVKGLYNFTVNESYTKSTLSNLTSPGSYGVTYYERVGQGLVGYGAPDIVEEPFTNTKTVPANTSISSFSGTCQNGVVKSNPFPGYTGKWCVYTCNKVNTSPQSWSFSKDKISKTQTYCDISEGNSASFTHTAPEVTFTANVIVGYSGYYLKSATSTEAYTNTCSRTSAFTATAKVESKRNFSCISNCTASTTSTTYVANSKNCIQRTTYYNGGMEGPLYYRPVITVREVKS